MSKRTTKKYRGSLHCRSGATAVEFAVVAPILFAFILGFIAFGQLVTVQQILTHAAREGCRKAALNTTLSETDVQNVVKDYLRRGAIPAGVADGVAVSCVPAPSTATNSETEITVTVQVNFADVCWIPITFFGYLSNVTLGGTCTMERE